jgi:pimeloyl-ACP methyl ester carboxylesterase
MPPFAFAKKTLEREFDEIMIIDFPGYLGFLSHTTLVPSMTLLQNVIQTIVDQHGPTAIMGHSLGGWLAGKAAQIARKPLEHLILVAPSGLTPVNEREAFGEFILSMQQVPPEQVIEKLVHESRGFHRFLKQEFNFFYSKPELKRFIESVKPEEFIDESVPFRAKKVSIIWGESDVFVPSHWVRHWIECYGPYIDVFMLPKVGHLPQLEKPKVISDLIQTILTQTNNLSAKTTAHWQWIHQAQQSFLPDLLNAPKEVKALPQPSS